MLPRSSVYGSGLRMWGHHRSVLFLFRLINKQTLFQYKRKNNQFFLANQSTDDGNGTVTFSLKQKHVPYLLIA